MTEMASVVTTGVWAIAQAFVEPSAAWPTWYLATRNTLQECAVELHYRTVFHWQGSHVGRMRDVIVLHSVGAFSLSLSLSLSLSEIAQIPSLMDQCAVRYCEAFDSKQHLLQNTISLPRKITDSLPNVHTSNCITVRTESYLQGGEEYCKECWRNAFIHGDFRDLRCLYTRPSVDRRILTQKGVWEQILSKFLCKSCNNPFKTTVRCRCCCDYRFGYGLPPISVADRGIVPPLANLSGAKYCEQFEMGVALISHLREYHT
ncbi:hypothetical protein J6590_085387 [Homalodisca vitripennis]|nr:hypothetical protein J6590_085382 [Homalodisca vitripennis]KAG8270425.1 hypothetical protein J6590_085387 [Homalodisca vitripennis]